MRDDILDILRTHGPLRFRKVEAHLVLRDHDPTTYDVAVALRNLENSGEIEFDFPILSFRLKDRRD